MNSPVVEIRDLAFTYPDGTAVLDAVNLGISRGERVAILGPNGAGKTTLILHLNGILEPQRGEVLINGVKVDADSAHEIRSRVGLVFQDPDDQLFMTTVRQDVAFGPANYGVRGDELAKRTKWALDVVGMSHSAERPPHHLSVGERRRIALATVLAMEPEVLVLDEPSSNLDPASRRELAITLNELDQTLIMVTHDLPYALELCDRTVIMDGGLIVADGPTSQILADSGLLESHRLELPAGFDPAWSRKVTRRDLSK